MNEIKLCNLKLTKNTHKILRKKNLRNIFIKQTLTINKNKNVEFVLLNGDDIDDLTAYNFMNELWDIIDGDKFFVILTSAGTKNILINSNITDDEHLRNKILLDLLRKYKLSQLLVNKLLKQY